MKTIYLTGFMGAGKTTIGKELGRQLSMSVMDTDEVIENVYHKSINDIFAEYGEAVFRDFETKIIKKLAWENVVVTTGGGIVNRKENRDWMHSHGVVIYLHCDPERIFKRLENDETRPLLKKNNDQKLMTLFENRLPYYLEADFTVNTTLKSVETIVDEIVNFLNMYERSWA